MSPPRRMLRASLSVQATQEKKQRNHWAQSWAKESRELEVFQKRNESSAAPRRG